MRGLFLTVLMFLVCSASAQRMSRLEYIEKYTNIAIEEMEIYGIPASITLAQGCLESANGNSRLAKEGNNHFGIKCKKGWKGMTMKHDDDEKDECFRVYASAEDSYRDHSEFLDKSPRYQELFKLDITDYKGWAHGLKAAGYATNPAYAQTLIKIIEDLQLYLLDSGKRLPVDVVEKKIDQYEIKDVVVSQDDAKKIDVDNYTVSSVSSVTHAVYENNGSLFVIAQEGDSYESLARMFKSSAKRLKKYNEVHKRASLHQGEIVYLKPKAKRSINGRVSHTIGQGETLRSVSQIYGIKIKSLESMNRLSKGSSVGVGQKIRLM